MTSSMWARLLPTAVGHPSRATPLELFFDLVFVFAFTQVTALMTADPTWAGIGHAALVLAVLWWTWAGYARLTNRIDPEEGVVRLLMLGAMGSLVIMTLTLPRVFGSSAVVFAVAYLLVRVLHLVLLGLGANGDASWRRSTVAAVPNVVVTSGLLFVAAFLDGRAQIACWALAVVVMSLWPLLGRASGWDVTPTHFVERFGLVILIALGESVVALGAGTSNHELDVPLLTVGVLGFIVVACLWWAYFDWVTIVAERRLEDAAGTERALLARDAYAYLHGLMVAGIVLYAFGIEAAIDDPTRQLELPLAAALCGGISVYLLAHVALRLRIGGGLGRGRPVAAAIALAIIPLAANTSALVTTAALAALCCALIVYEVLTHRDARAEIRAHRSNSTEPT